MVDREEEIKLVALLKEGDPVAFDRLYEAYRPRVFGFLARLCGRRDLAEDLLQETWIRVATRAATLKEGLPLGPWIFTVARNLYLSWRRWRLLDAERVAEMMRVNVESPDATSPFEHAAASETERELEQALSALPLRYREVLLLVVVEGMSHEEAAGVMELKPEALRQRRYSSIGKTWSRYLEPALVASLSMVYLAWALQRVYFLTV
jgi:RNA polymerase sigma-70 factor (ECF subfamily)